MVAMGSDGEGSHDERSAVTLQIQLMDRSTISVQTELDLTVEEFKLVLADLTGVPSDEQWLVYMGRILRNPETLRSYELEPDQSIHLLCIGPSPPSTSVGSMPREQTPYKIISWFVNQDAIDNIIEDIPFLSWLAQNPNWAIALQHPIMLHNVLLFHLSYEINVCLAMELEFLKADVTDNIKADTEGSHKLKSAYEVPTVPKVACVYDVQFGIPFGTEENQLSLGLLGWSLVDTSGSGPESSNANQSELATNSNPFSGPEAECSNANQSELATNSNPFSGPEAESSNANQSELATNDDLLSEPESSNANLSKSGPNTEPLPNPWAASSCESVGRAFTALLEAHNISHFDPILNMLPTDIQVILYVAGRDLYDSAFNFLVNEVNAYFRLILENFHPLQYYAGYGSGASNDGVIGITPEVAAPEEIFASQLAQMERMGFMDMRENIIALLGCWGDVKKAVEMLNSKKAKS
ncbi:Ubiquitin domain-containing protein DSK2b [Carex littledalei]|uniref:Ubiquitin domain-containing protein DSK2b n=1 Tax=Carex littledalei TaxID=544730 RepID=A0A833V4B5_9POAL|nr:Ubiquitin domain-containing protein DSK2b [Carex littledalei]